MVSRMLRAAAAATALVMVLYLTVLAHSGEDESVITVEPAQVTPGGTVVLAGTGLEPTSDRAINLVGPDVVVPFDMVTTDADGMFSIELTIPAHLPAGTYTFQAVGDETLTTEIAITRAANQVAPEPRNEAAAVVSPRNRPARELVFIALVVLVSAGGGLLLVTRAEVFGQSARR